MLGFYHNLPVFTDFKGINEAAYFHKVPENWWLIIADIVNSTAAIEQDRYKDVNTIGAAVVAAAQNALSKQDIPFVFGGDGASLLLPPDCLVTVCAALSALRIMVANEFRLELRVGQISVAELSELGFNLEITKYQLAPGKSIAIFRGGALLAADNLIKTNRRCYEIPDVPGAKADLTGLSCRWNPIPSQSGHIVSLLVLAKKPKSTAAYRQLLQKLTTIYADNLTQANPVKVSQMTYKTIGQCLRDEIRYHSPKWTKAALLRWGEIILAVGIFRFKLPLFNFDASHYRNSLSFYSDYQKFDDLLRMVIDCSPAQIRQLRGYLEVCYREGELYYGLHESSDCLMTCYVQDTQDGGHIHFIDGGSGGYAMAARQLKAQLSESLVL
ncbi:MAG: DUF3095 domain-containing protein [Methylobacter sp.]